MPSPETVSFCFSFWFWSTGVAGFLFQAQGLSDRLKEAQGTLVKDDQSSPAGGVNRFQTTRWSVVLVSAQSQAPVTSKR